MTATVIIDLLGIRLFIATRSDRLSGPSTAATPIGGQPSSPAGVFQVAYLWAGSRLLQWARRLPVGQMMNPARRSCLLFALPQVSVKPISEPPDVPDHTPPAMLPAAMDKHCVKASAPARAAMLVVVTMVAMVSLPPLIDRDDLV